MSGRYSKEDTATKCGKARFSTALDKQRPCKVTNNDAPPTHLVCYKDNALADALADVLVYTLVGSNSLPLPPSGLFQKINRYGANCLTCLTG